MMNLCTFFKVLFGNLARCYTNTQTKKYVCFLNINVSSIDDWTMSDSYQGLQDWFNGVEQTFLEWVSG